MQHVDRIGEFGDVDYSESAGSVPDPDFLRTRSDCCHRLPIGGSLLILHPIELVACFSACRDWEVTQIVEGAASELERFHVKNI